MSLWIGYHGLIEKPDSGHTTVQDKTSRVQTFTGTQTDCLAALPARGTLGINSYINWKVESAELVNLPGDIAEITINWIPINGDLPIDEVSVTPREMPRRIELHPRYEDIDERELELVHMAALGSTFEERDQARYNLAVTGSAEGIELAQKLMYGEETYYWTGLVYEWTTNYWTLPSDLTLGGFIEDPIGPMLGAFPGMQALRTADKVTLQNYIYKVTRTWWIAEDGNWDPNLYS